MGGGRLVEFSHLCLWVGECAMGGRAWGVGMLRDHNMVAPRGGTSFVFDLSAARGAGCFWANVSLWIKGRYGGFPRGEVSFRLI